VRTRKIYTTKYGALQIKDHTKKCDGCGKEHGSDLLPLMVKKGNNYAYDCIVQVGMLRYTDKKQIHEIVSVFKHEHGLEISQTQVRRLSYSFLEYLGKFHYLHAHRIIEYFQSQGGYILYVDSTCEGQAPHLLTCIDGNSGFVLYSQKLVSENQADLEKAFSNVKQLFGDPLCCVHDMGGGINNAIEAVFIGVVSVICHFHLLRDIGKDLFNDLYQKVKKTLSGKKIYASIRYQVNAMEKLLGGKEKARELFYQTKDCQENSPQLLQGIVYGYLQKIKSGENSGDGYGFPFDRPRLIYYKTLEKIHTEMEQIEKSQAFSDELLEKNRFYKVKQVLSEVLSDKTLANTVKELDQHAKCFDKLRDIMRIAVSGEKKGLNDPGKITSQKHLSDVESKLKKHLGELNKLKQKMPRIQGVIKQLEKYWKKIFTPAIETTVEGQSKTIVPQRTNNTSEQFYRRLKQLLRRLHGNSRVNKDLLYLPEEIALIENLSNNNYMDKIMKKKSHLVNEFAKLDIEGKKLPYQKQEFELVTPQKIKKILKNFKPLEYVEKIKIETYH